MLLLASLRLAYINLLLADEDYHLAAAIQILKGHVPYRDFWYDKPPLAAFYYLTIGAFPGWPLRILDTGFVLACCGVAYRLAKVWWGAREGIAAALLLAFFTTFYLPSATIPFAVDGLLLLPHLAAIYFAFQRQAFWSGICCAFGLLTNVKAAFVAATCALWLLSTLPLFCLGLLVPLATGAGIGWIEGALPDFYRQVWSWGFVYARSGAPFHPVQRGVNWLGFHAALVAAVIVARMELNYRVAVWLVLSTAPLIIGSQLAPRYFFQLLPVMVILASRGVVIGLETYGRAAAVVLALLLIAPLVRFGPRYAELMWDNWQAKQTTWSDAAMDVDSQQVAGRINSQKSSGDTLFVWGYRPDVYVYTRLTPAGKFSDSQPLDGVPADRHLVSNSPSPAIPAQLNRAELIRTYPTFIVDGLGLLNPKLSPESFPDLRDWMSHYRLLGRTSLSRIYVVNTK